MNVHGSTATMAQRVTIHCLPRWVRTGSTYPSWGDVVSRGALLIGKFARSPDRGQFKLVAAPAFNVSVSRACQPHVLEVCTTHPAFHRVLYKFELRVAWGVIRT